MNEMKIFKNNEFGIIRIVCDECGNPWFCGKDVAEVLNYGETHKAIKRHVAKDDGMKRPVIDRLGRRQQALFINESGLYSLILSSKLPSAKNFKHWVTSEVLPAIRKDGGYIVAAPDESDEVILARAIKVLQTTLKKRDEEIALLQPKADYADEVLESVSCFTTTQIAKEVDMTANQLNRLLCRKGIQYGQSGQYLPYAKYARLGYARNRTFFHNRRCGRFATGTYLVWTEKGRRFIHQLVMGVA